MIDPNINLTITLADINWDDVKAKLLAYGPPPVPTQDLLDKILNEEEQ